MSAVSVAGMSSASCAKVIADPVPILIDEAAVVLLMVADPISILVDIIISLASAVVAMGEYTGRSTGEKQGSCTDSNHGPF